MTQKIYFQKFLNREIKQGTQKSIAKSPFSHKNKNPRYKFFQFNYKTNIIINVLFFKKVFTNFIFFILLTTIWRNRSQNKEINGMHAV